MATKKEERDEKKPVVHTIGKKHEEKIPEQEAYFATSAAREIGGFLKYVNDSLNNTYIPTGFNNLDNLLDGGLFQGLYVIGAISSLGKTTFALQIADQVAAQGTDVLIFSLEMPKNELIAKSISRETFLNGIKKHGINKASKLAKTSRGIMTGARYVGYTKKEKELIDYSVSSYVAFANHIYIHEGIGNISAIDIRKKVEKHIRLTGNKPLVIIDYLQILAPMNNRATDKQKMDDSVLELKRISRDLKLPILAISSLNRENYNQKITMTAFKESGAIEYSTDVLMGIQVSGLDDAGSESSKSNNRIKIDQAKRGDLRALELVLLKNRNGPLGEPIKYFYAPLFNYFEETESNRLCLTS